MSSANGRTYAVSGVFVVIGLASLIGVFLVIGREKSLFRETYTLTAQFDDASGLMVGAQVWLAGVEVGTVRSIRFGEKAGDKKVRVDLGIDWDVQQRIRRDSVATIGSRGLLGDKNVTITMGSQGEEVLQDGDTIATREPPDVMNKAGEIANQIETVTRRVSSPENVQSIEDLLTSIRDVVAAVKQGDGIVNKLIFDPKPAKDAAILLANLRDASAEIRRASATVARLVERVEKGPGLAHAILYDPDAKLQKILADVAGDVATTAEEIAVLVKAIRTEKGVVHRLIWAEGAQVIVDDAQAAVASLRRVAGEIEAGRGTLGGIVKDPTIYEDLKQIVGEVKRNKVLRALVRMAADAEEGADGDKRRIAPAK